MSYRAYLTCPNCHKEDHTKKFVTRGETICDRCKRVLQNDEPYFQLNLIDRNATNTTRVYDLCISCRQAMGIVSQ